jgi:6-phosphogluconolactonase
MPDRSPSPYTIWKDPEAASVAAAHFFINACHQSIAEHGKFVVALAGGNTPKNLYKLLASDEFSRNIPWKKVFIFLSDERFVSLTDEESNYWMINENLLIDVPLPKKNIFPIPFKKTAKEAATLYEKTIRQFFNTQKLRFDMILLGIGNDGHTASLFPGTDVLKEKKRIVKEVWVEEKKSWRISLTLPVINKSKQIIFLVTGKEKAPIIKKIFTERKARKLLPVKLVNPSIGSISWILDNSAAAKIMGF